MTFPTIPTVAAGKVITGVQTGTSATRTSPNLNTLTSPSGELIVAICYVYNGTSAAANFSGWTNGFTELTAGGDTGSNGGLSFGIASKWSGGSETGTVSVTQAGTITGEAAWIIMSIPGAHDSTPPEAGGYAAVAGASSNAIADATSFNPAAWDVADTLWIAVHGAGETSGTGAWTSVSAAPSGFTDYAETGQSADTVGGVEGAVAFRAEAVAAQDPGAFTGDGSNSRSAALVIAVRPAAQTQFTLADVGGGADSALVAAQAPLADAGVAADGLSASQPSTDATWGSASATWGDATVSWTGAAVSGNPTGAEQGAGADSLQVAAQVSLADSGAAADAATAGQFEPKTLAEQGAASDSLAAAAATLLAEVASGTDQATIAAAALVADAGAAADSLTSAELEPKTLPASGAATDGLQVAAQALLAEQATAADSLSVDTGGDAKTLADAGGAADNLVGRQVPAVEIGAIRWLSASEANAKALTDAGAGAADLSVVAAAPPADEGIAADLLAVAAQAPLAEQATAADSLTVEQGVVAKTLAEEGAAADALTVTQTATLTLADQGAAAEVTTTAASLTLAQAGAATTDLFTDQAAQKTLAEQATATDSLPSAATAGLADSGQAVDLGAVAAAVPLAQAAAAADTLGLQAGDAKTSAEQGTATDALRVAAALPLAEQGAAAETLIPGQAKTLPDQGAAAQALAVDQTQAKTLADSGGATDSLRVAAAMLLAEVAAAAELATIAATLELAEVASGGDSLFLPPEAIPGDGRAWVDAPAGTAYADRVAAPGTAYADKTLGKVSVG